MQENVGISGFSLENLNMVFRQMFAFVVDFFLSVDLDFSLDFFLLLEVLDFSVDAFLVFPAADVSVFFLDWLEVSVFFLVAEEVDPFVFVVAAYIVKFANGVTVENQRFSKWV